MINFSVYYSINEIGDNILVIVLRYLNTSYDLCLAPNCSRETCSIHYLEESFELVSSENNYETTNSYGTAYYFPNNQSSTFHIHL